jgi:hypothetical protein
LSDDRKTTLPVHLGDTEIVDGVIVHDGRVMARWSQVAAVGATVVAGATFVAVGVAVTAARRKSRSRSRVSVGLLDEVRLPRR